MALFDPVNLARQLCALWGNIPLLSSYTAPSVEQLRKVLEIAFSASMETEEGRSLRFGLLLLRHDEIDEKDFRVARFGESRPLSITEIRRLAPATNPSSTFIAVEQADDGPRIWGAVDAGSDWTLFRKGEKSSGIGLPFGLVISVAAPGSISVRLSDSLLVSAAHGQVAHPSANVLKFGPVHDFFRPVLQQLVQEALPDRGESDLDDHFLVSYGGEYLRFLARTLQYVAELGHGGTIAVLREDAGSIRQIAEVKYETTRFEAWGDLVDQLRLIYNEIESGKVLTEAPQVAQSSFQAWREVGHELRRVSQRLVDLSRFLARLTQVDGALLVTDHLRILGFGAVIKDLANAPSTVRSCWNERCDNPFEEKSESYGTRHRSAMALCRQVDCVVFVLSQDGGVKALKSVGEHVLLWPSVSLDPSAWFITAEDIIPELRERYLSRKL